MSSNGPFFAFSSSIEYKNILIQKLRLFKVYNEKFFDRFQNENEFLRENQVSDWLKYEIYPKFTGKIRFDDYDVNVFQELSKYAKNKIFTNLDENTSICFNQTKEFFFILSNYAKYASFIRNPLDFPSFSSQLLPIRSILYDQITNNKIFSDFLPFGSAQCFIELSHTWNRLFMCMNQLMNEEAYLLSKSDEAELSSPGLETLFSDSHQEFGNLITDYKDLFTQNHSLTELLSTQFLQANEFLNIFKQDIRVLNDFLIDYKNLLIQMMPIDSALKILNNENYFLFVRPPEIKINSNIFAFSFLYEETIKNILNQIEFLKKNFAERCQFERYLMHKYDIANNASCFQYGAYQNFKRIVDFFDEIIENIDVFDESYSVIQNLSLFFNDRKQYNDSLINCLEIANLDEKIDVLQSLIEDKKEQISVIQNETQKTMQNTQFIQHNIFLINSYKQKIIDCPLCLTNRSYVLTNCGHTFCDSCYQIYCLLRPEDRKCRFCQTPFTFDTVVKISWSCNKISEDEDEDSD